MDHAIIEIVEYGDYRCEHCAEVFSEITQLQHLLGNDLRFVFRHFPQPRLQALSVDSALAAETAGLQGKFWEMHQLLFENQKYLNRASICWLAEELDLDMQQFERDRNLAKMLLKITSDFESGVRSGVDSTPAFFVNGEMYIGFSDYQCLLKACRQYMPEPVLTA
jgi:protein-disulfide isomerase